MTSSVDWLPYSTPLDPSEDPPASIDPLGLTTPAEYLADFLVPGFTARMWRARMLTLDAVAAHIADGVVKRMNDRDDVRLPARLVFERLYVSSVARAEKKNVAGIFDASRALPGIALARAALLRPEALSQNNFLKGQAVNGPVGVTGRLAKNMDILTADMRPGRSALELIQKWADDENLPGVLDIDSPAQLAGTVWANEMIQTVINNLSKNKWPRDGAIIWDKMLSPLCLNKIGKHEKNCIKNLLDRDPARECLFAILRSPDVQAVEQKTTGERSKKESIILTAGVLKNLGKEKIHERLRVVIGAIESYEFSAELMTQGFDALLWGLKRHGRLDVAALLSVSQVNKRLKETAALIPIAVKEIDSSIKKLNTQLGTTTVADALSMLSEDLDKCTGKIENFLNLLLDRHERVQKMKRKGAWIDRSQTLTLLPGFGIGGDVPPVRVGTYLHPFRIANSYSFLVDLGLVKRMVTDETEIN